MRQGDWPGIKAWSRRCWAALPGWLVLSCMVVCWGCDLPGRPDPADRPVSAERNLDFTFLHGQYCAGCHGADGMLGPAPPLNDPIFRAIVPEEELESIITRGRPNTLMPAFALQHGGTLTALQIQVLVKQIKGVPYRIIEKGEKTLAGPEIVNDANGIVPKWGRPPAGRPDVPRYRAGVGKADGKDAGSKERGAEVFSRACAVCHGDSGRGLARGGETMNVLHDRVFLAKISNQALRRLAITGRPDLGMPSFAEPRDGEGERLPLTEQDIADLVALLASWRTER